MVNRSQGYSLVELMIVVAILSIVAMIAIPAYTGYVTTARQVAARGNIEPLRLAVEDFRLDNLAAGYAALNGLVWEPAGAKTLESGVLGWSPDGDQDMYNYGVTATATTYTITVTPIGHAADAQSFSK
ncbi:MAG: prepilin-type N-terminal cleavage/methylation domain-containing protein [Candidatus Thiodiazotropha sp. (ex Notomyrtea botanica)]|nr:prepilin-type N-terminal cleavage/methylation domain-containing protein [Candidatus Thiodiazotropha sp. (ex Notomyrtea botanica)]